MSATVYPKTYEAHKWASTWHQNWLLEHSELGQGIVWAEAFLEAVRASEFSDYPGDLNNCGCMMLISDDGNPCTAETFAMAWLGGMREMEAYRANQNAGCP